VADYLTYANLSSQVADLIDDDSGSMATRINGWLNDALRELWTVIPQGPVWTTSGPHYFTLTQGTSTYNLSATNPGQIIGATLEDQEVPLKVLSEGQLLMVHKKLIQNGNATPVAARFRQVYGGHGDVSCYLDVFPAPDANIAGKKVYYTQMARFTGLSASTQVPKIPAQFHDAIKWGGVFYGSFFAVDAILATAAQMWNRRKKDFQDYALELVPDGQMIEYGEQTAIDYNRGI